MTAKFKYHIFYSTQMLSVDLQFQKTRENVIEFFIFFGFCCKEWTLE